MAGRSSKVYPVSDEEKHYLASKGWSLPPVAPLSSRGSSKYREFHHATNDSPNHIPGNCYKQKDHGGITESRSAPPDVRYAAITEKPLFAKRPLYAKVAPPVLDLNKSFSEHYLDAFFDKDVFVYFNCQTGTVESVIRSNDREARTFYDHYYSCPNMVKGMSGDLFASYVAGLMVLIDGTEARPRIWLNGPDMLHYVETTQDALTRVTFSRKPYVGYAGVDAYCRPSNLDLLRVRTVVLTYR